MIADALDAPPDEAAHRVLGARLLAGGVVARVVDVEAYGGADDAASHACRGETPRNRSMFGPPGRLYVYRCYGLHWCANVVCGPSGDGAAVLLRGVEVLEGADVVADRRGGAVRTDRLDGPGRLTQGLAIDGSHDGVDLFAVDGPVQLALGTLQPGEFVHAGPRIGISKETERPWRFRLVGAPATDATREGRSTGPR